ncbi:MAG: beta-lactamase family protein [Verrucomicrobiaceae bacterium]|nr:beta-lactamase family protein [Verrucomicrobiaceae bacterium]
MKLVPRSLAALVLLASSLSAREKVVEMIRPAIPVGAPEAAKTAPEAKKADLKPAAAKPAPEPKKAAEAPKAPEAAKAPAKAEMKKLTPALPVAASVADAMQHFVKEGTLSGAVTLVAQRGKVLSFEATGLADIASKRPMEKDSLFWIASMTKPITALGVMMLQEEGKLSIHDPVEKHLPEFKNQLLVQEKSAGKTVLVKPTRPITIKDLLTHTSGLVGNSPLDGDALDVLTLKEAVITYALSPLQFEPGSKWSYCNPGINTLGRIIEVVSGMDYARFMEKRILGPVGMQNTTFWPQKSKLENLATSYKPAADGKGLEPVGIRYLTPPFSSKKRTPLAAGGLFSTAEDLLKLYQMLLDGGVAKKKRLISEESLKLMTTAQIGDLKAGFAEGMSMGLGFQLVAQPAGPTAALSAGTYGHGGAHGTQGWIDPVTGAIHILLIQRSGLQPNGDSSAVRAAFHAAAAGLLAK